MATGHQLHTRQIQVMEIKTIAFPVKVGRKRLLTIHWPLLTTKFEAFVKASIRKHTFTMQKVHAILRPISSIDNKGRC
jgi:hypothetical protein